MTSSHLGTIRTQLPEGTTSYTSDGIRHTIVKTMPVEEAYDINTHIAAGNAIQILDVTLAFAGFEIEREAGEIATVTYSYFTPGTTEITVVPGPDSLVGRSVSPQNLAQYDYDVAVEPVSILRHPKYKDIAAADKRILATMIQNGPLDSDGNSLRSGLSSDVLAQECATKIENGQSSVLVPALVARVTREGIPWAQSVSASKLGTRDTPNTILPGSSLFDFLLTGLTVSGNENGIGTYTETYQSAPFGEEWDMDLYT